MTISRQRYTEGRQQSSELGGSTLTTSSTDKPCLEAEIVVAVAKDTTKKRPWGRQRLIDSLVSGISTGRRYFHRYRNSFHQRDELNLNVRNALRHKGVQKNQAILRSQFTVGIPFECLKMQRRHQPPMSVFTDNGRDRSEAGLSSFLLKHYVTGSYC